MKPRRSQSAAAVAVTFALAAFAVPAGASPTDIGGRQISAADTSVTVAWRQRARRVPMAWLCSHYPPQSSVRSGCAGPTDVGGRQTDAVHVRMTVASRERVRRVPMAWLCGHYPPQSFLRNGCA